MIRLLASAFLASAFAAGVLATSPSELSAAAGVAPRTRTVYITATDSKGVPITDLTAADFTVKEGGKEREVVKAEPATAPMQVAIIVDDNGSGLFRGALISFLNQLLAHAEFAISSVTGQTQKLVDYTKDVPALQGAVARLLPRPGTPDGGQLLEGISETAKELLQRKAERPVIVALTVGGEEHSTITAHQVLNQLRDSSASLHVISVASSAIRSTVASDKPGDALEGSLNLNEVLGDGPKQSGGRRDEIVATAGIVEGLKKIADDLLHQYAISYTLPDGVKPDERLSVATKRKGVSLRAPSRIPDK
jgi:VWFA-related protein